MAQRSRIHLRCRRHGSDPWVTKIAWRRDGNPLQCSCLETPMDGGAWRAAVHGASESGVTDECSISSLGEDELNE